MIYCHECGSEINEVDTFCPFCGIVLNPSTKKEETSEIEQDKTVAVNHSDFQDILNQNDPEQTAKNDESEFSSKEDSEPEKEFTENKFESSESFKQDVFDSNFDFINEAELKDEDTKYSDETKPESSFSEPVAENEERSNYESFEQKSNEASFEESEAALNDLTLVDVPREVTSENDFGDEIKDDDSEIENESVSNEESLENVSSENQPEETKDETVEEENNQPENGEDYVPNISYSNFQQIENEKAETPDLQILNEPENSEAENKPEVEIAKPVTPVEEEEAHDTTFDSVRIMDDAKFPAETEPEKAQVAPEIIPVSEPIAESKEKSYTTPNIGVNDTDGRKSAKLKPLDEGTVLNGRYEIVRKIGGGGMGAVYLATDRNLGGILRAVKEMIQSYIEETQQDKAISDFKRESMLLTSLDHPSIPTIYDYFYDEKEGRFYLVMKYISGGDLASRLRAAPEGKIDEESVISWAIQIADVLDYLHNRQPPIVYRDLKPANVMIDGNSGRTMLIDFGIARWVNKEEKGVTAVGTMGYAPPELFSGNVEPSSDIYSLGSTMFHLLTGADPQSNPLLIFDFQKHPRPRQINPRLSDQIEKILLKMVEYNADKRYRTAGEVRDELTKHLESLKGGKATFGITKAPSAVAFSDQKVFCGFCGQKIVATDMFCAFCGSRQPLAQQGVHSAEYHLPHATAKLVVIGTNDLEVPTFVIEKDDNLLGRRDPLSNIFPEIDLSKYDPQTKISRRHAHIFRDGKDFYVEDLGSSNGTLILRVVGDAFKLNPHQPHTLVSGEKIKIGDTTLHFVVG